MTKHKNTEWEKNYRDLVNLHDKLIEKRVKASIDILINHKKELSKEASKGKIMP